MFFLCIYNAMAKVRKAVITAAGYATRFLPITKAVPKEMLPLGDKPVMHYILQELQDAGITDVLILIGRGRECLQNYLDKNYEIDDYLLKSAKNTQTNFFGGLNIFYRRVPLPRGVADCVHYARDFVADEPFVLAYCDDVFFDGNPTREMLDAWQQNGQPCLVAATVPLSDAPKYGIIDAKGQITEKPAHPTSNLAAVGRYLLPPTFFELLDTDMIVALNALPNKNIITTRAKRFDTGNKHGFFAAFQYIMSQNWIW